MTDLEQSGALIDGLASHVKLLATLGAVKPLDAATRAAAHEFAESAITWRKAVTERTEDRRAISDALIDRLNGLLKNKRTAKAIAETLTLVREYFVAERF